MLGITRRGFITLLGGVATWPLAARAQQEPKRLGVLRADSATDPTGQSQLATFIQGLRKLGWVEGQNLRTEVRWTAANPTLIQAYATDLVGLFKPDVLLAHTTANLVALQAATSSTIPIVFTNVADPVEQGLVKSLTHPGGNITGFVSYEFSIAGKWADLLKQMAPSITRVAYLYNVETAPQSGRYASALEVAARLLGLDAMAMPVHSTAEIEGTLERVAKEPNIGLIVSTGPFLSLRAKLIVETVARTRIPTIYGSGDAFITEGGLMQYSNDASEPFRLAPFYIDRILKGTKPADLPVRLPTKFKFIVNRKTASALGIDVPLGLLLAADEVIE